MPYSKKYAKTSIRLEENWMQKGKDLAKMNCMSFNSWVKMQIKSEAAQNHHHLKAYYAEKENELKSEKKAQKKEAIKPPLIVHNLYD